MNDLSKEIDRQIQLAIKEEQAQRQKQQQQQQSPQQTQQQLNAAQADIKLSGSFESNKGKLPNFGRKKFYELMKSKGVTVNT